MLRMTFGSLFAGIGGMDLGLERAGMECKWQVEIDPFCQKVLAKHWPNVKRYGDITTVRGSGLEPVDLLAGGFPCQDLSVAGKRAGIDGARSGLWAHFARLIGEIRPRYVLIENVSGLLANEPMRRVLGDLSSLGFDAEWRVFRACEFGAEHERERVFVTAYALQPGLQVRRTAGTKFTDEGIISARTGPAKRVTFTGLERRGASVWSGDVHGIPGRMDRIKALGNAIYPAIPEWIGRQILNASHLSSLSYEPTRPGNT